MDPNDGGDPLTFCHHDVDISALSDMSRQLLNEFLMSLNTEIHAPLKMNFHHFGHLFTFLL